MKIYALHGFLGRPGDWDACIADIDLIAVDLFKEGTVRPFSEWAQAFNQMVASGEKKILMGYSMGGRLGLHAVLQKPELWGGAIFISTNLGLPSDEARQKRLVADEQWALRFRQEPWSRLMRAWEEQDVFCGRSLFERLESDYQRSSLSSALIRWSTGMQGDLRKPFCSLEIPVLWVTGGDDIQYVKQAQELCFKHPQSRICTIPKAGHRVPWEQPQHFLSNVKEFLNRLRGVP